MLKLAVRYSSGAFVDVGGKKDDHVQWTSSTSFGMGFDPVKIPQSNQSKCHANHVGSVQPVTVRVPPTQRRGHFRSLVDAGELSSRLVST